MIKINKEIELTSIIVNTHNQSRGKRLNPDLSKNPSLQDHKKQVYFVPSKIDGYSQQPNLVGPVLESHESICPPSGLTQQRFNRSESESSSSKKQKRIQASIKRLTLLKSLSAAGMLTHCWEEEMF